MDEQIIIKHIKEVFPRTEMAVREKIGSKRPRGAGGQRILVVGAVPREQSVPKSSIPRAWPATAFSHQRDGQRLRVQLPVLLSAAAHLGSDVSSYMKLNVNYEDIVARMREIAGERLRQGLATRFHTGILLDYLCFEKVTGFTAFMAPFLADEAFGRSTVDMWSKGNDVRALLDAAAQYPGSPSGSSRVGV
jgi:hypothetical protein